MFPYCVTVMDYYFCVNWVFYKDNGFLSTQFFFYLDSPLEVILENETPIEGSMNWFPS